MHHDHVSGRVTAGVDLANGVVKRRNQAGPGGAGPRSGLHRRRVQDAPVSTGRAVTADRGNVRLSGVLSEQVGKQDFCDAGAAIHGLTRHDLHARKRTNRNGEIRLRVRGVTHRGILRGLRRNAGGGSATRNVDVHSSVRERKVRDRRQERTTRRQHRSELLSEIGRDDQGAERTAGGAVLRQFLLPATGQTILRIAIVVDRRTERISEEIVLTVTTVNLFLTHNLDGRHTQRLAGLSSLRVAVRKLRQVSLTGGQLIDALIDRTEFGAGSVKSRNLISGQLSAALRLSNSEDGLNGLSGSVALIQSRCNQGTNLLQHWVNLQGS